MNIAGRHQTRLETKYGALVMKSVSLPECEVENFMQGQILGQKRNLLKTLLRWCPCKTPAVFMFKIFKS